MKPARSLTTNSPTQLSLSLHLNLNSRDAKRLVRVTPVNLASGILRTVFISTTPTCRIHVSGVEYYMRRERRRDLSQFAGGVALAPACLPARLPVSSPSVLSLGNHSLASWFSQDPSYLLYG
ncbi:hypothetical protein Pcinc_038431 [Petrolisthes cinctipes]|uniref:Uncharacterized protein n=1 Tax=Petrolisthes cinctipes TaxID=88211 RepID=A0AAE1BQN7_PETCI|nr:hypothetical protein Pcinc_038431 [Petrolisthes cinctipes]